MSLSLNDNCGKVDTTFILQLKQINQFKEMRKLALHHKATKWHNWEVTAISQLHETAFQFLREGIRNQKMKFQACSFKMIISVSSYLAINI